MPDLIAVGYDDTTTAVEAMDEVARLAHDLVIQPDAVAAIVRGDDGKFRTITNQHEVGAGATWGMFWGFLFGLLFFIPVFGMVFGAGFGALSGSLADYGINDEFIKDIGKHIPNGSSAFFVLIRKSTPDKVLPEIQQYNPRVLKTSLSNKQEEQLRAALEHKPAAA